MRVQQGVLHALFGRLKEAETAFRKAITDDPTLISPYVNLANVRLIANDNDGALLAVKQGLARNADSALLNLVAARIYSNKGDAANSAACFAKVRKAAPEIAAQFADLAPAAEGSRPQRAANAGQTPVAIWGTDQ
jgi:tetratricopeptide (TPR) repeat protein